MIDNFTHSVRFFGRKLVLLTLVCSIILSTSLALAHSYTHCSVGGEFEHHSHSQEHHEHQEHHESGISVIESVWTDCSLCDLCSKTTTGLVSQTKHISVFVLKPTKEVYLTDSLVFLSNNLSSLQARAPPVLL